MRAMSMVAFPLLALLAACGGEVGGAPAPGDAAPGDAAPDAGCVEHVESSAGDGGPYSGAVVASSNNGHELLSAGFPYFGGFPSAAAGTACNCVSGIPLPVPSSGAGTITVQAAGCGPVVASLGFATDAGFATYVDAPASWTPGDALFVSAAGSPSQVHAFAGTLQTPLPLAGLSPAVGPDAKDLAIALDQPVVVSWTPEGRAGETVGFALSEIGPNHIVECGCFAPDSAGTLTVPPSVVARFVPTTSGTTATASASRSIETVATADDATVNLVGVVAVGGAVVLR